MIFKVLFEDYHRDVVKAIRDDLRKAGFKVPAQVTVRQDRSGSSIDVIIKDLHVGLEEVITIAKKYEEYERDERTGEILQGGNLFVFVKYDYDAEERAEKEYTPKVIEVIRNCLQQPGQWVEVSKDLDVCYPQDDTMYASVDMGKFDPWTKTERGWPLDRCYLARYRGRELRNEGYSKKRPLWRLLFDHNVDPRIR